MADKDLSKSMQKQLDELRARCAALERDVALLTNRDRSDRMLARLSALEARPRIRPLSADELRVTREHRQS